MEVGLTFDRNLAAVIHPHYGQEGLHVTSQLLAVFMATAQPWDVEVTGYCPCAICCGRSADGITASGAPAQGKLLAAPPEIPFGTMIYVPGYSDGPVPVLDRGGAIKGDKLDLLFPTHDQAARWGRRKMTVWISSQQRKSPPAAEAAQNRKPPSVERAPERERSVIADLPPAFRETPWVTNTKRASVRRRVTISVRIDESPLTGFRFEGLADLGWSRFLDFD